MLNSNDKGLVAELEIALAATRVGVPVLKPLDEHARCDLAFDIGGRFWRVQCKWGRLSEDRNVVVVATGSMRLAPSGYVRTTYTDEEVDLFGVYAGELDRSFLLPASVAVGKHQLHLRLTPPLNNQSACITLAEDFDFVGAVAQMARASRWQREGQGFESPQLHSSGEDLITVGSNPFRDKFGYWMERVSGGEQVVVTHRGKPRIRLSPATGPPAAR